jgi:epoxyqueuosine reductase
MPSGSAAIAAPTAADVKRAAHECGFELAGIARAEPSPDAGRYSDWVRQGMAGAMGYLTGRRADVRMDPRNLLESAQSIVCVGKLYNGPQPYSTGFRNEELGWISRYAWGADYHDVLRRGLEMLAGRLSQAADFDFRICVDTAPLLERSYARDAGLGWIGRNTCLIHQHAGSWFFLGELLTSLDLDPDEPVENRCGACTRCIDACPTAALVPAAGGSWSLDARRCISYLTIELRGAIPEDLRAGIGPHVFGCDICQDVCPWNRRPAMTIEPDFAPQNMAPPLERMARLSEQEFTELFRGSPAARARYGGFLRNVAIAMGNARLARFREPLERLASLPNEGVAEHARWALRQLQ